MDIKNFTEHPLVIETIEQLKKDPSVVSDVVDDKGHQYVDLVQEGGGVLGIALLGYTYVLEKAGIRFFSLAGTSAGAINTLLLASAGRIDEEKTEKILGILTGKNLFDFVDAPFFIKVVLKTAAKESRSVFTKLAKIIFITVWMFIWGIPILTYVMINKGLNPGNNFRKWLSAILKGFGITTNRDLDELRNLPPDIQIREGVPGDTIGLEPKLKIIAAEITTETRVLFPENGKLFWNSPASVNPADYVRASMSIPLFFRAFEVETGPGVKKEDWENDVKYNGHIPARAYFVDGGVLSNFPIDVFHNPAIVPRLPTFGVKLGYDRDSLNAASPLSKFLLAIFNSARHVLDYQFLLKNDDYEKLIQRIDIGPHNWLNFSISDKDKTDLFVRGAVSAGEFLREFNWSSYKNIRASLLGKSIDAKTLPAEKNIEKYSEQIRNSSDYDIS